MMSFALPRKRHPAAENIVPMINVVFLLLIFFLMSAQIAPPDPFEVTPPASIADSEARGDDTLYVSATGALSFDGAQGDAVWSALATRLHAAPLKIRADEKLNAADLAALLPRLAARGVRDTLLVTGAK